MRRLSGFSLMEMMIVLLIVAIVAAASAPMVTKKLVEDQEGSDCLWTLTNNDSIFFNGDGNNAQAVIIGHDSLPANTNSKLFIKSTGSSPHIILNNGNSANDINIHSLGTQRTLSISSELAKQMDTTVIGHNISLGENASGVTLVGSGASSLNSGDTAVGNKAQAGGQAVSLGYNAQAGSQGIAIGYNSNSIASTTTDKSVAIGYGAQSKSSRSISIGSHADASAQDSIAIGSSAVSAFAVKASAPKSMAIGYNAKVSGNYSIAIGSANVTHESSIGIGTTHDTAVTTADHQILLGDPNTTVYIPGNLVVGSKTYLGTGISSGSSLWMRTFQGSKTNRFQGWVSDSQGKGLGMWPQEDQINHDLGSAYNSSDRRLKNVGKAFVGGLEELKKLDLFHYTYKKDPVKTPHVGVMAQDLQKIFPNAVVKGDDGFLRIRMEDMFYAVINAVKELDNKITEIKTQIKANIDEIISIKKRLDVQEKRIQELEKKLEKLEKRK